MTPEEALTHFLSHALQKRWRERYISLIQTKSGKKTFLNDLYHELEDRLDPSKTLIHLPDEVWNQPAYSFNAVVGFGRQEQSLRIAVEVVSDGCLIIDTKGNYGIHKPEDMVDDIRCFNV